MNERGLAVRLAKFRLKESEKELLKPFDRHELLAEIEVTSIDDIMTDDATVIKQYREDAQAGIIPMTTYLMKAYAISLEEAEEIVESTAGINVSKITALNEAVLNGVMSIRKAQQILELSRV